MSLFRRDHPAYAKAVESAKKSIMQNRKGARTKAQRMWECRRLHSMTLSDIVLAEKKLGHKVTESTVSKYIRAFEELQNDAHNPQSRESAIAEIDGRVRELLATIAKLEDLYQHRDDKPPEWATKSVGKTQAWSKGKMPLHSIFQSRLAAEAHIAGYMRMRHALEGLNAPASTTETGYREGEKSEAERMELYAGLHRNEAVELSETVTKTERTMKMSPKEDNPKESEVIDVKP